MYGLMLCSKRVLSALQPVNAEGSYQRRNLYPLVLGDACKFDAMQSNRNMAIKVTINLAYEGKQGETIRRYKRNGIGIPVLCDRSQIDPFEAVVSAQWNRIRRISVVACAAHLRRIVVNRRRNRSEISGRSIWNCSFNHFADCGPCTCLPCGHRYPGYVGGGQRRIRHAEAHQEVPFPVFWDAPAHTLPEGVPAQSRGETVSIKFIRVGF